MPGLIFIYWWLYFVPSNYWLFKVDWGTTPIELLAFILNQENGSTIELKKYISQKAIFWNEC